MHVIQPCIAISLAQEFVNFVPCEVNILPIIKLHRSKSALMHLMLYFIDIKLSIVTDCIVHIFNVTQKSSILCNCKRFIYVESVILPDRKYTLDLLRA